MSDNQPTDYCGGDPDYQQQILNLNIDACDMPNNDKCARLPKNTYI